MIPPASVPAFIRRFVVVVQYLGILSLASDLLVKENEWSRMVVTERVLPNHTQYMPAIFTAMTKSNQSMHFHGKLSFLSPFLLAVVSSWHPCIDPTATRLGILTWPDRLSLLPFSNSWQRRLLNWEKDDSCASCRKNQKSIKENSRWRLVGIPTTSLVEILSILSARPVPSSWLGSRTAMRHFENSFPSLPFNMPHAAHWVPSKMRWNDQCALFPAQRKKILYQGGTIFLACLECSAVRLPWMVIDCYIHAVVNFSETNAADSWWMIPLAM